MSIELEHTIIKGFVVKFDDHEVTCMMLDEPDFYRVFKRMPFFMGMELFEGKNFWIETWCKPGVLDMKFFEAKDARLAQLLNYWNEKEFEIGTRL